MELSYSNCLKELPDFSTATNLYELDLTHSSSLVKLSSSIGNAINLQNLNLSHCSDLVEIPSSIITNLKSLDFYGYSSLVEVPFNIEEVIDSIYINLSYCSSMVEVPSSTENAINLKELNLKDCSRLVEIPFSIGNAFYLQKLNMSYCASLVELPSSTGNTANFEEQDLDHCRVELPSSMRKLGGLSELELKECSKLEVLLASINLESLGEVNISDWSLLKNYPENSTDVQETDPWMGRISGLRKLVQSGMEKLESLPPLPDSLWALDAENGESLERLGSSFRNPDIHLSFLNYFKLNQEEKDLIIQTPSNEYAVFPGGEMPQCFTYRSSGSSLTVKLNQMPIGTSTKFKACILCAGEDEKGLREWERASVCCSITTSGGIALSSCLKTIEQFLPGNLYTFEFEVETDEVTSTELVFEFEVGYADLIKKGKTLEIKECGIMLVNMIESFGNDNSSGAINGARESADPYQLLYFI
ncbi:disease resistance protein TAO1 [Brassica napus]|uniref:disease resistance protein TAO1 n=1 Tax=Brassica napus TaxID=3708 RepID=UPI002078AA3B|nr:disease resistance protein TAO1 [Brassica napus]